MLLLLMLLLMLLMLLMHRAGRHVGMLRIAQAYAVCHLGSDKTRARLVFARTRLHRLLLQLRLGLLVVVVVRDGVAGWWGSASSHSALAHVAVRLRRKVGVRTPVTDLRC